MRNTFVRLLISAVVFLAFTWGSTVYYMKYIHDVGGTYWSMGVFGLPAVLLAIWCIDFYLKKVAWFRTRLGTLTVIDSLLAIALYYPGFMLVWGAIYVFGIA
jgi:hypothetical protein